MVLQKEVIKEICAPTAIFGMDTLMGKTHWEENALPLHDSIETYSFNTYLTHGFELRSHIFRGILVY